MALKTARSYAESVWWLAYAIPVVLGATGLVVMFFRELSPDPALFLVYARDTLAGIPRFAGHFDTKGPVWNWLVVGAIEMVGVRFGALALIQLFSYIVVTGCLAIGAYRMCGRRTAYVACSLWLALIFTPAMDGAGGRPEDVLVVCSTLGWLLSLRLTRPRAGVLGVLAGVALMVKMTGGAAIVLFAAGVILTAFDCAKRERVVLAFCAASGFLLTVGIIAGVVAATDDLREMVYQTMIYPRQYAAASWPSRAFIVAKVAMMVRIQMMVPLGFALLGGWLLWSGAGEARARRSAGVTIIWLLAELLIWTIQGRGLPYHWTAVLPAMVLCLAGWARPSVWPAFPKTALLVPLVAVALPLAHIAHFDARVIRDRIVSPKPSPASHLANELRPLLGPDDVVVVGFYDVSLYAYLGLKLPLRMANDHLQWLDEETVAAQSAGLESSPPDWIILERDEGRRPRPTLSELPNFAVYEPEAGVASARPRTDTCARELLEKLKYPLVLETRTHRAYRRPAGGSAGEARQGAGE